MLEVVMTIPTIAPPLSVNRTGVSRPKVVRSVQDHRDVSELDDPQVEQNTVPHYNHRGTIVVASAWLAFYVIAALMAQGNSHRSSLGAEEATRSAMPPTEMMGKRAAAR
jgi:hypothetical protein